MKTTWKRTLCGAALSAVLLGASSAAAVETGQMLDKGPKWPHKGHRTIDSVQCPGPACTQAVIDQAVQRGEITPKEAKSLRKIQNIPQAKSGGGGANTLAIVGGIAAVAAIAVVASSGGSSSP